MFRVTDHPVRDWPRFLLFTPPEWLWRLALRLPLRLRVWIVDRLGETPGICRSAAIDLTRDDGQPWASLSARTCRPDSEYNRGPCWCGKYQTAAQWAADMQRAKLHDPIGEFTIEFLD